MVYLEHFSDHPLDYINEFYTAEKVRIDSCPHCHSCRRLHLHGIYHRHVIWYEDVFAIPVQRHYCIHCGKTVSILPSFCHPGFQLALPFLLELLLSVAQTLKALSFGKKIMSSYLTPYTFSIFLIISASGYDFPRSQLLTVSSVTPSCSAALSVLSMPKA